MAGPEYDDRLNVFALSQLLFLNFRDEIHLGCCNDDDKHMAHDFQNVSDKRRKNHGRIDMQAAGPDARCGSVSGHHDTSP